MRLNQVDICIDRFGKEVPKGYPADRQRIHVYSDSNNLFEALSMAYAQAVNVIREWQPVAARTDITTNADTSLGGKLLGRDYRDDWRLEYYKESLAMQKDLLYVIEHSEQVLGIIRQSGDKDEARRRLMAELNMDMEQVNSVFRIRFEMFTQDEIAGIKEDIEKIEQHLRSREEAKMQKENGDITGM